MSAATEATDVQARLKQFISRQIYGAGGDIRIAGLTRAGTGTSRENWQFDASWTEAGKRRERTLLLRRDPPAAVVHTARSAEFGLLRALGPTDVPAPVVLWLDDDGSQLMRPGMIVERYGGVAHRAVLRETDPLRLGGEGRALVARRLCELLATVHRVDIAATGISETLPHPGSNPAEYELLKWQRELDEQELEPQPALRIGARWLADHLPSPPSRLALVHGDFRPANVLIQDGWISVLLDWELAHIGDPLDDLGWYCAPLYRTEHFIPGEWEEKDLIASYGRLTGLAVPRIALRFWQVMATFRLAVMALIGVRIFCEGRTDRPAPPPEAIASQVLAAARTE